MAFNGDIDALTVADEYFLVTSLIDRCPKTMMLRELVVNAIEAASNTASGPALVEIEPRVVGGAPKLCIWNTGPGMSADELDKICDISSSLGKAVSLDGNFGMGAKVASLASNTNGLVIRSCKDGIVSQVIIGKRDGVYGRILQRAAQGGDPRRVLDVTARCRTGYDLSTEWTEVVLNGNEAAQDTVADPYAGSPAVPKDWVYESLAQRFFRLPEQVAIKLLPGIGRDTARTIRPLAARMDAFTRAESVQLSNGRVAHYFYLERAPEAEAGLQPLRGVAGIVHKGEIYGLRKEEQWALEAPSFGVTFGARAISILIELPDTELVRPEAYRQFLRYSSDDQRQVVLLDFADELRAAMPGWLRRIINDLAPPQGDYLAEVREELRQLILELDLTRAAGPQPGKAAGSRETPPPDAASSATPPPPGKQYESPPEIITIRDPTTIGDRGLQNRAARFFPSTRQLFVNLLCPAIIRMDLHMRHLFADYRDQDRVKQLAMDTAEWSVTRMVARALIHTLAKEKDGWSKEEIARAQSTEALTLVSDGYEVGLPSARARMLQALLPPDAESGELDGFGPGTNAVLNAMQRREVELVEGERAARRALELGRAPPGPFLRRLSEIANRRRDAAAALDWAQKAVEADPQDPWSQNNLAGLLLAAGDAEGADKAARAAMEAAGRVPHPSFLLRLSEIEAKRKDTVQALTWARRAAELDPSSPLPQWHIAGILMAAGQLDEAERAALEAVALGGETAPALLFRRVSEIAQKRMDMPAAIEWANRAVAADPGDPWSQFQLSNLLLATDLASSERAARLAISLSGARPPAPFLRRMSEIELRQGRLPAALDYAQQAVAAGETDAWAHNQLAVVKQRGGDLEGAEAAAERALELAAAPAPAPLLRTVSEINAARNKPAEAMRLARLGVELHPEDGWSLNHLAGLLLQEGDLDGAEQFAMRAVTTTERRPVGAFLRRVSEIWARRRQYSEALNWALRAVEAGPDDSWNHSTLASAQFLAGDLDAAELSAQKALELHTGVGLGQVGELLSRIRASKSQAVAAG